jgi:hypothetical protein
MADRLSQVAGHITNSYGRGLLAGEVAIITGMWLFTHTVTSRSHDSFGTGGAQVRALENATR